eukprot:954317-Amphidinium_carterae.2
MMYRSELNRHSPGVVGLCRTEYDRNRGLQKRLRPPHVARIALPPSRWMNCNGTCGALCPCCPSTCVTSATGSVIVSPRHLRHTHRTRRTNFLACLFPRRAGIRLTMTSARLQKHVTTIRPTCNRSAQQPCWTCLSVLHIATRYLRCLMAKGDAHKVAAKVQKGVESVSCWA